MKNNKIKYILSGLVLVLLIILSYFGKEVIEEKDLRIKKLESQITKIEIENKELSIMLEQKNENKDIEITETKNKDGSYTKTKKVKINKESSKGVVITKDNNTKIKESKQIKSEIIDKSKKMTNQKRLRIGLGIDNDLNKQIYGSYKLNSLFGVYGTVSEDKSGSVGLFIEF